MKGLKQYFRVEYKKEPTDRFYTYVTKLENRVKAQTEVRRRKDELKRHGIIKKFRIVEVWE